MAPSTLRFRNGIRQTPAKLIQLSVCARQAGFLVGITI